jgi:hypothetical protein
MMRRKATELYFTLRAILEKELSTRFTSPTVEFPSSGWLLRLAKYLVSLSDTTKLGGLAPMLSTLERLKCTIEMEHRQKSKTFSLKHVTERDRRLANQWLQERSSAGSILNVYSAGWEEPQATICGS